MWHEGTLSLSQELEFCESRNKRLERSTCLALHTSLEKIQAQSNPVKAYDIGAPNGCLSCHHTPLPQLTWMWRQTLALLRPAWCLVNWIQMHFPALLSKVLQVVSKCPVSLLCHCSRHSKTIRDRGRQWSNPEGGRQETWRARSWKGDKGSPAVHAQRREAPHRALWSGLLGNAVFRDFPSWNLSDV